MMDMNRAMGPCRARKWLRPDRPPIAHSFPRPLLHKPPAAGVPQRALLSTAGQARVLHSSRAVSVRSISSVRGEEFVTLPGADSDSGCKLIHLTEGTGADKLLVYLPGGHWEEHSTLREGCGGAEPLPHAWGVFDSVRMERQSSCVPCMCAVCVCGGGHGTRPSRAHMA